MSAFFAGPPILFAAGFIGLVGSVLLVRNSAYGGLTRAKAVPTSWLLAAVVQAIALFGHALRPELPPWAAFGAVNAMQLLAVSLLWLGAHRMNGRDVPGWVAVLPPMAWLLASQIPGFLETRWLRLSFYIPLAYGAAFWTSYELLRLYRRHQLRAALDMAVILGVTTLLLLATVVYTLYPMRVLDLPQALFTGLPALLTALFGTTLPFLMLALMREWDAHAEGDRRAARLEAARAELERLLAGLPALIFLREVAPDGSSRRVYIGGDIERVTGLTQAEAARRTSVGNLAHMLKDNLAAVVRSGAATWQWEMASPDGTRRRMWTHARVLERRPGDGAEVVGYVLDITAQREAEARAIAAARMASLGEMATGLAHELRQSLQSISLAAEIAQFALRGNDAAKAEERLERIVEHTQRASELIEQLRRFARGADGGVRIEPVPLAEAVQTALTLSRGVLLEASIRVDLALGHPAPTVRGQSVLLEQVLMNLLLNARDALASRPVGAPRRIRIEAAPAPEGRVRLTVADTGGGIAPEVAGRLFEPFVTTKGPDKGTGLGLSICHGLLKGMGGSIEADNDTEGAVFTITLQAA